MKKIFFILLFFITFINANLIDIDKNIVTLTSNFSVSTNVNSIEDAIANPSKFKQQKYLKRYIRKKVKDEIVNSSWYKFDIVNSSNKKQNSYIFTKWENVNIDYYLVENNKIIKDGKLNKQNNFSLSNLLSIEPKQNIELFLNVKVKDGLDNFYYLYIVSQDSLYNLISEKEIFNHGILLGLLIAMMMYNFFMYFSMKIKSYLYLGFYQFAVVVYVSDIHNYLLILFKNYPYFSHVFLNNVIAIIISISYILFVKEFLNTKKTMPFIDKLLTISIFLHITLDFIGMTFIDWTSLLYTLYIIAGYYSFKQGKRFSIFFILGSMPTTFFYIFMSMSRILDYYIYVEYISMIQLLVVIEAFALSMALYIKLKDIAEEKEKVQEELHKKEKLMLEQSRFATMGEMLASISHQWKQPLNHITAIFANLEMAFETKKLTKNHLNAKTQEANAQLKYMATTIEDFNNFLSSKKELEEFTLETACQSALFLSKSRIDKIDIKINTQIINDQIYLSYKNGLIQTLLIVLHNAFDALKVNNSKNRYLEIIINKNRIDIIDNAGGIPDRIISKIFDPYFSTKDKKFGTGLGLYTAKIIMEKIIKGKIVAQNTQNGAKFTIFMPKEM